MFLGTSEHTLDEKNRLILPKKDRDDFRGKAVITYDFDGNLTLFTTDSFKERADELNRQSQFDLSARKLRRITFGNSVELTVDGQGRILLPKFLLDKAKITKNITLVGDFDKIEVWDTATYKELQLKDEEEYSCLAQEILKKEQK